MQGWSWIEQRTEKGIRRGLEYFRQATSQDPQFTLALVGQAFALLGLFGYGHEKEETVLPEAEKLINKALLQDAHLAEAHSALGLYHNARQEGPQAIEALLESVKIRPGYANAHNKLSWQYQLLGEPIKAMESAKNAVELDPFSPEAVINLAFSYLINGLPDDALREARRTYNLQPEWPTAAFYLGLIYYHLGNFQEARKWVEALQVPWTGNGPRGVLALIESATGNMQAVEGHLEYFRSVNDHFHAGLLLASLGRTEGAVTRFMETDRWEPWPTHVIHHLFHKELSDVKSHPGFDEIMHSVQGDWGMAEVLQ
jgi:superkiller protein 3